MKQLSIAKKLALAFGILFLLFAGFGYFAVRSAENIGKEVRNIGDWMESRDRVAVISETAAGLHRAMMYRITVDDPAAREKWAQAEQERISTVNEAFAEYEKTLNESEYDDPAEKESDFKTLNEEKKLWETYRAEVEKIDGLLASGNRAGADVLLEREVAASFSALIDAMEKDAESCRKGTGDALEAGEAAYRSVISMAIAASVLILVLSVLVLIALTKSIKSSVTTITATAKKAADGDLSRNIDLETGDEFGEIANYFNEMLDATRSVLLRMQGTAEEVSHSSDRLTENAEQSAQATQSVAEAVTNVSAAAAEQMDALAETTDRVDHLREGMANVVEVVRSGMKGVNDAVERAGEGNSLAANTVQQMNRIADTVAKSADTVAKLGESSKEIGSIVEVITGIAGQTNLLALNAAIEAARAGEHGRGFAVVAEEVRKLAEESRTAAEQIGERIRAIQDSTDAAVRAIELGRDTVQEGKENVTQTGEYFQRIVAQVEGVRASTENILTTIEGLQRPVAEIAEQAETVSRQARAVADEAQSVSASSEEQAAGMDEIANSSRSLAGLSTEMQQMVSQFRLREGEERRRIV
ncbi:MAG: methyl-accepting chemotaxis protein [Schwartzia sp.]|nr:methyl-accepting chemotaxis protein [Schwartzia sp. (in: firmicutes)]